MTEKNVIKVLLIEAEAQSAAALPVALKECVHPSFEVALAKSTKDAARLLDTLAPDIILLSLSKSAQSTASLRELKEAAPRIPLIILAHTKDEEAALQAVREGAQDYLIKSDVNPRMISRVIRYAISRKQSEESLHNAYEQIEHLLASLPSILIGVNPDGVVTHWNAVAETVLGIQAEKVVKKQLKDAGLRWDHEKIEKGIRAAFSTASSVRVDDVMFMKDKTERLLGFRIIPIRSHGPSGSFALLFGADITERKQLELMKDEFVSTVSHELRTPLLMIREGVALVNDGILGGTTTEQRQFLTLALENIDRLTRIINDLLDISKIEAAKMKLRKEKLNLNELVKKIESTFAPALRDKAVALRSNLPAQTVEIEGDPDKLTQIFTNLVQNAVKFTEKGTIEITVKKNGGDVECRVSDTGRGISAEDLPKVFSKFQQFGRTHGAGAKGTGLGLSICKGLVELHGGKIHVESQPEKGTQFIFTLPAKG